MVSEEAKKELYEAATKNDVATFQILVQQDPFLVDHVSFPRSRSLLHFAAENGRVEIARELLSVAPRMCWWLDDQGMNPVHIAAMRGQVEILKLLLQLDLYPALERLNRGQTVMHLCVKHRQLETLECLVEKMSDLVNVKDDDGETLLHLAVRCNQLEMVKYLLDNYKVENLTANSMGKTALDILRENSQHTTTPSEILMLLHMAYDPIPSISREITDVTMVVVGLIAAMAFSAAVNPPGGVWQEDTPSHRAGKAVMASSHPTPYKYFSHANNAAFISSLIVILLAAMRAPSYASVFFPVILGATLASMMFIGISYGTSLIMTNPIETLTFGQISAIVAAGTVGVIALVLVCTVTESSFNTWKRKKRQHTDRTITDHIFRFYYRFRQNMYDYAFSILARRGGPPPPNRPGSPNIL